MAIQSAQTISLQKLFILATGSAANSTQMSTFNGMVSSGGFASINTLVDAHIAKMAAQQGLVATVQAIALNGFGMELSDGETQTIINTFRAAGIDTGSKFLNHISQLQGTVAATLDNRAQAAADFVDTLSAAGKSASFTGKGVTEAVQNLLQNIGSSSTSLANATSAFNSLSANLSSAGINGTVDGYLSGATVFGDSNRDGVLNAGEWSTTTNATGTFVLPNSSTAEKLIVFGGVDLMTGNAFQGQLSAAPGTLINPFTTLIEAMVASGQAGTVLEASTMLASTLGLPTNINLLSYNPLAVLGSTGATAAEKAVALSVQAKAQQISNVITQLTAVIDNATAGATHESAAAAVTLALVQAVCVEAGGDGTLSLVGADLNGIVQAAFTATGTTATPTQQGQIVSVLSGNNAMAAAATTITMLGQAADVAQGSATNALIAGALANNYLPAQNNFAGAALTEANYNVTVGSIIPGVVAPPTDSQVATADANAAAAAAALAAPTASLLYSTNGGLLTTTTASVQDANTLRIIATFNKPVTDDTPTITINNAILAVTAMTKSDSTHYYYDLDVPAGDVAAATVTIGGARDATSNTISAAPTNPVFTVDNTAPDAPTAVTLTSVGGTVTANTLNNSNTNLTATATITAGQASGGTAILKVGATTIATDSNVGAADTSVTFNLGTASTAALQAAVAAGGVATVTITDAAGNAAVSTAANPTLVVDYSPPTTALTTVLDTLSGAGGDDLFTGTYGNGGGPYTFNAGDILDALGGTNDRIKITTGAEASTLPDGHWASVSNFEEVFLQSIGNGAQTFTSGANFLAAFGTSGVELSVETLLGAIDITLTSFTGAATITTTTIGAAAHTITTGSGVTTVTADGLDAGAQTINGVGLTTVNAEIVGAGDQIIGTTLGGNLVTVNATIGAAGAQTIASTSGSDVTIVAEAFSGAQTITTANGNDNVTTIGAAGQLGIISTGSGNDTISAGLTTDVITGGTGVDTMTGGGAADTFQFNADGSLISAGRDIITDFNTVDADVFAFGSGTAVLLTADATALVGGLNVQTSGGGLITFHAADNTLALKIIAIQADAELDAAGSVAMFVDGGNTYVYYAGPAVANADDQLIQLSGITSLTTIIGGATMVIS